MSKAKANPYERNAKLSVGLAALGGLAALAAMAMVLQNLHTEPSFEVRYAAGSKRFMAILGATAVALLAGTIGFFTGLSSAGHKRNKLSHLSWTGFFSNAGVLTIAMSVFVFFWLAKEKVN